MKTIMSQKQIVPVLSVVNQKPITNSLNIAAVFGKPHGDVLKAIRALNVPLSFTEGNFSFSEYADKTGRKLPMYNLTRDGFTLLAMGFTGTKAMQFKIAYIEAFNAMEAELRRKQVAPVSLPSTDVVSIIENVPQLIPFRVNLVRPTAKPTWMICAGCGRELSKWAFGKTPEAPHGGFCIRCRRKLRNGTMAPEIEAAAMSLWMYQTLRPVAAKMVMKLAEEV